MMNAHLFLCHLSFVSTHVMSVSGQVWLRWFSQADARRGVFLRSPSLVAVTQEVLSFHYPALTCRRLSQTEVLREYRCRIITGPSALWISGTCCKHYTLQHPSQAHLPITHCWAHTRCNDVGWDSLLISWECTDPWERFLKSTTVTLWYPCWCGSKWFRGTDADRQDVSLLFVVIKYHWVETDNY